MGKFSFNTREFSGQVKSVMEQQRKKAEHAMTMTGHFLLGEIRKRTPVDEGFLTADVSFSVIRNSKSFSTHFYIPSNAPSAEYCIEMHEGFYHLGPHSAEKQAKVSVSVGRRFITGAIDQNHDDILFVIKSELGV